MGVHKSPVELIGAYLDGGYSQHSSCLVLNTEHIGNIIVHIFFYFILTVFNAPFYYFYKVNKNVSYCFVFLSFPFAFFHLWGPPDPLWCLKISGGIWKYLACSNLLMASSTCLHLYRQLYETLEYAWVWRRSHILWAARLEYFLYFASPTHFIFYVWLFGHK